MWKNTRNNMRKNKVLIPAAILAGILILSASLVWFIFSSNTIGLVDKNTTDEEAIAEVVAAYFQEFKNYTWNNFEMKKGLKLWTEKGKEEQLTNPDKLPALAQSIQENKISRKLINFGITALKVDHNQAEVIAITNEESTSDNFKFNGSVQTQETLTLIKENNLWRIDTRDAVSMVRPKTK